MNDWTADRLAAQPEDTMIRLTFGGEPGRATRSDGHGSTHWSLEAFGAMARYTSEELFTMADPGSIRVVSVPIDALLSPAAMLVAIVARDVAVEQGADNPTHDAIRAAVAHVTGDPGDG